MSGHFLGLLNKQDNKHFNMRQSDKLCRIYTDSMKTQINEQIQLN